MSHATLAGLLGMFAFLGSCQPRDEVPEAQRLTLEWDPFRRHCVLYVGGRPATSLSTANGRAFLARVERDPKARFIADVPTQCRRGSIQATERYGSVQIGFVVPGGPAAK
jgi:hypothetical protein